jgi:hypothetical protein
MMRRRALVRLALVTTAVVPLLVAPSGAAGEPPGPDWGTDATHTLTLHAMGFVPDSHSVQSSWYDDGTGLFHYLDSGSSWGCFGHSLVLPSGSYVTEVAVDGCDDSVVDNLELIVRQDPRGPSLSEWPLNVQTTGTPGCASFPFAPFWTFGIDNQANAYLVRVCLPGGSAGSSVRFKAVRVSYHLHVSPAPASATFGDVPTDHWAFQHVEALVASGITAGCGGGNYCPEQPLTRAQMAVFLAKGLGLHWE